MTPLLFHLPWPPFSLSHIQPSLPKSPRTPRPKPLTLADVQLAVQLDQGLSQGPDPTAKDLVTSLYRRLLGQLLHVCPWAQASLPLVTLVQPDPCQGPNPLAKDSYTWMTSMSLTRQDLLLPPQPRGPLCP